MAKSVGRNRKALKGKTFWLNRDENGYYGIGPTKHDCNREFPEQISPRLEYGETIRVRIVEAA
jgi:hypothetical protein